METVARQSAQRHLLRHGQLMQNGGSDKVSSPRVDERRSQLVSSPVTQSAGDKEEERRSQLLPTHVPPMPTPGNT